MAELVVTKGRAFGPNGEEEYYGISVQITLPIKYARFAATAIKAGLEALQAKTNPDEDNPLFDPDFEMDENDWPIIEYTIKQLDEGIEKHSKFYDQYMQRLPKDSA